MCEWMDIKKTKNKKDFFTLSGNIHNDAYQYKNILMHL
jgi:hypothetical protein